MTPEADRRLPASNTRQRVQRWQQALEQMRADGRLQQRWLSDLATPPTPR
nr:hypothetical protein [Pseudomonas sp. BIGb0427]